MKELVRMKDIIYRNKKKSHKEFLKDAKLVHGDEFIYLEDYKTAHTKIKIYHKKCNRVFSQSPNSHVTKEYGCTYCGKNIKKTQESFISEARVIHGDEFEYVDVYDRNRTPIKILHNKCGEEFYITPYAHIIRRQGCPFCKIISKGSERVKSFLTSYDISYITEQTYPDCKDISLLRFDFYLPEYNVLIEYDGKQHFHSRNIWGGEEGLSDRQKKDGIKNRYCIANNIPLVRIRYDIKDIEGYLKTELEKLDITL